MAYTIDRYNNSNLQLFKMEPDPTTDLKLVGKNYVRYGEIQNENFVFPLENFFRNTHLQKSGKFGLIVPSRS